MVVVAAGGAEAGGSGPAALAAARARAALVECVPARLLLPALAGAAAARAAEGAAGEGDGAESVGPMLALLGVAAAAFSGLSPAAAEAAALGPAAAVIETALGVRERRIAATATAAVAVAPPKGRGASGSDAADGLDSASELAAAAEAKLSAIEDAASAALVALAERLSEAPFARLLSRLQGWALSGSDEAEGEDDEAEDENDEGAFAKKSARLASFFGAANAVAERLRSVFAPFGGALVDVALATLEAGGEVKEEPEARDEEEEVGSNKRARRSEAAEAARAQRRAAASAASWLASLRALRLLHRCLAYDAGGAFADAATCGRLLNPLVAALVASGGGPRPRRRRRRCWRPTPSGAARPPGSLPRSPGRRRQ